MVGSVDLTITVSGGQSAVIKTAGHGMILMNFKIVSRGKFLAKK